jgi:ABC-type transport system involved in cytochrome c biogenesis permease component
MTLQVVLASGGGAFVLLIVGLLLYFVPSVVAFVRSHHNKWAIFALNLLLGWTFLGWIAALVWSLTRPSPQPQVVHMVHEQAQPPAVSAPPDPPVQS